MSNCCDCRYFYTSPFDYPCVKCKKNSHFESIVISKSDVINMLEKIKAEINEEDEKGIYFECKEWGEGRPCDEDYFYGLKRAIMIIDKHISEFEGETNE